MKNFYLIIFFPMLVYADDIFLKNHDVICNVKIIGQSIENNEMHLVFTFTKKLGLPLKNTIRFDDIEKIVALPYDDHNISSYVYSNNLFSNTVKENNAEIPIELQDKYFASYKNKNYFFIDDTSSKAFLIISSIKPPHFPQKLSRSSKIELRKIDESVQSIPVGEFTFNIKSPFFFTFLLSSVYCYQQIDNYTQFSKFNDWNKQQTKAAILASLSGLLSIFSLINTFEDHIVYIDIPKGKVVYQIKL